MVDHNQIRELFVKVYNMNYDKFLTATGFEDNYYAQEKFGIFKRDFPRWYCSLDSGHAKRFITNLFKEN